MSSRVGFRFSETICSNLRSSDISKKKNIRLQMIQKKAGVLLLILLIHLPLFGQTAEPIEVMTVGAFHFSFPNNDVVQVDKDDQIDVLEKKYQSEIKNIVDRLAAFEPTIIAIERRHEDQHKIDSLYQSYKRGEYELERSEDKQIGFRLAKRLNLDKIYAVDGQGKFYNTVKEVFSDSARASEFEHFYFNNDDVSQKYSGGDPVFATQGILAELIRINQPEYVKKTLGNYLIGQFKYEFDRHDYFGADFETNRWFNRNLRIFRNLQRVNSQKGDRLIIIFGAGHLNLLNLFFEASPEYTLINPLRYLKD